jgi:hypothetical protein
MIVSVLQPLLGKIADYMYDESRKQVPFFPDILHWIVGWILITFGLVTIITGLLEYGNDGLVVVYSLYFALLIIGFFGFALYTFLQKTKKFKANAVEEYNLPEHDTLAN